MTLICLQPLHAHNGEGKGRGLVVTPPEVLDYAREHLPTIVDVKPTKIGLDRIQEHLSNHGLPPLEAEPAKEGEEATVVYGKANVEQALQARAVNATLPSSVDNSQLPSFPPIGDQQQLGSCVGWGTTYYQGTHEYGLLNGINNKSSQEYVFSPKWTYNMMNGGADNGLDIVSTYQLFTQNGFASLAQFPYDTNYLAWDLNPEDWVSAISRRFAQPQLVSGIGGTSQNLQVIKQLLNNGHVLVFGTFIDSWVQTQVGSDPNASSNPYAGQLAASWCNGQNGGHCMTIVGYNDDIWIDINGNGEVDAGEKGAFLIANSWNTDWGNEGFVWIAYDAFLSESAVTGGPSSGRVPLADATNSQVVSVLPLSKGYAPKLVAQFTLSQAIRDQINVVVGVSETNATAPSQTFTSCALYNKGGNFEFNGAAPASPETATFAVDLTELLPADPTVTHRYYLTVGDNQAGNATVIDSFTLIDLVHNQKVNCTHTPLSCDNSKVSAYIDYSFATPPPEPPTPPAPPTPPTPPAPPPPAPPAPVAPLKVATATPHNYALVSGTIQWRVNATAGVGVDHVDFYIDSQLCLTDPTAPYLVSVDTTGLDFGTHDFTAIAYDTSGNSASSTVEVFVFNY